jgi:hypothetical protein
VVIPYYLGNFDTSYVIFRNAEIWKRKNSCEGKIHNFFDVQSLKQDDYLLLTC